jgi:hypothetical protein
MAAALAGADHVTRTDAGDGAGQTLVTADVDPDAADAALHALTSLGVPAEDVWLLRLEGLQPGRRRRRREGGAVVWADLLGHAGERARPVGRFLMLMAVAGIIATYGVIYSNGILIVGPMAVSPDFLPIAATCIGLVARRRRLVGRAFWTLTAGLGTAGVIAGAQLVLASRSEPPFPVGRLRAHREVLELTSRDFVMTRGEATALLERTRVELGATEVDALVQRTEGWPAGLYLAAVSLREQPDPAAVAGAVRRRRSHRVGLHRRLAAVRPLDQGGHVPAAHARAGPALRIALRRRSG